MPSWRRWPESSPAVPLASALGESRGKGNALKGATGPPSPLPPFPPPPPLHRPLVPRGRRCCRSRSRGTSRGRSGSPPASPSPSTTAGCAMPPPPVIPVLPKSRSICTSATHPQYPLLPRGWSAATWNTAFLAAEGTPPLGGGRGRSGGGGGSLLTRSSCVRARRPRRSPPRGVRAQGALPSVTSPLSVPGGVRHRHQQIDRLRDPPGFFHRAGDPPSRGGCLWI